MSNIIRLPGLIDIHAHFRDPGETHKEDFYTGTSAALAGGVTTVFDMPNNIRPVFTSSALLEKLQLVKGKAVCNYGLYFGSIGENLGEFEKAAEKAVGLKVYLSLTTGKFVIAERNVLADIFNRWPKEKIIVVHSEGDKIDMAIEVAGETSNKIHITHVNTKDSLEKIIDAKKNKINITCDVTPHHLFLTVDDLNKLGQLGLVKPPLATKEDQAFLWENLDNIDCIASDHAPHTVFEKLSDHPAAGVPELDTYLPLLLNAVYEGKISVKDVIRLTNTNPQKIFGFKQDKDTYVEADADGETEIKNEDLKTKCKWSPYAGWAIRGKVSKVFIRGIKVFENSKILVKPGFGQNIIC